MEYHKIYLYLSCTLKNKNMKKVFFIIGLGLLITSCGVQRTAIDNHGVVVKYDKTMVYYDTMGFCQPTLRNIQSMYDRRSVTGENYFWCGCDWRTKKQCDVLDSIALEESNQRLIKMYQHSTIVD